MRGVYTDYSGGVKKDFCLYQLNSNYGAKIKAIKIAPIVRDWKFYNKFCNARHSRVSLFYIQKRAFKVFNKESKQDFYSVVRVGSIY